MGFKGTFSWITSLHQGGRKAISFTLKNTNLLQTATFDAAIVDGSNAIQTRYFYGQKLRAGQSATYDIENGAWDWAQGDFFCILDEKGRQVPSLTWTLKLPEPAPGECKECHGSHKCAYCGGNGKIFNRYNHTYEPCTVCRGTGICQTCFIPMRQNSPHSPIYSTPSQGSIIGSRNHRDAILNRISELEHEIYILEQKNLNIERNGGNKGMWSSYYTNNQLIHAYRKQVIDLQTTLASL